MVKEAEILPNGTHGSADTVNIMAVDALAPCRARASATMILTHVSWNILALALDGLSGLCLVSHQHSAIVVAVFWLFWSDSFVLWSHMDHLICLEILTVDFPHYVLLLCENEPVSNKEANGLPTSIGLSQSTEDLLDILRCCCQVMYHNTNFLGRIPMYQYTWY